MDTYTRRDADQPSSATEADGFVVVARWTRGRTPATSRVFEEFEILADAAAWFRNPPLDFEPIGIFASKDGLPVAAGSIPMDVIDAVKCGYRPCRYGLREFEPNTIENLKGREQRRADARKTRAA